MMGDKLVELSVMEAIRKHKMKVLKVYDRPHQPYDLDSALRKHSETYRDLTAMVFFTMLFIAS